jgi:hypothetical protein
MSSSTPPPFQRPKKLLPGPIAAKILLLIGAIFAPIGVIFTPIGLFMLLGDEPTGAFIFLIIGVVFFLIGAGFLFFGGREVLRWRRLIQYGVPAWGMAIDVDYDTTVTVNNQHPIALRYAFVDADGQTREGTASSVDHPKLRALKLDRLQVLYDPNDPTQSLLIDLL